MPITFKEPTAPRYIYINPANNLVHLLVPFVQGQDISTDNTCKSAASLNEFFNGKALQELSAYKTALEEDVACLKEGSIKNNKQLRLQQINTYIQALTAMNKRYQEAVDALMQSTSNLYSIQLRPSAQDHASRVINPVFSIERRNAHNGTPLSALFNALHAVYPSVKIAEFGPKATLIRAVEAALAQLAEQPVTFKDIQNTLTEQCQLLFQVPVNFTKATLGAGRSAIDVEVNQAYIDDIMGGGPLTQKEYIDKLISACAPSLEVEIPTPPFYRLRGQTDQTEKLSIATQFFLANANIYCRAHGSSNENFGAILDASNELSLEVARNVFAALQEGKDVEENLCDFINQNQTRFGLSRRLSKEDITEIQRKFEGTYRAITATKENPHMDDFMMLYDSPTGKFVTHQGAICTDFSMLESPALLTYLRSNAAAANLFQRLREDFIAPHEMNVPPTNQLAVQCDVGPNDIDWQAMLTQAAKKGDLNEVKSLMSQSDDADVNLVLGILMSNQKAEVMNDAVLRSAINQEGLIAPITEGAHKGQSVAEVWINSKRGRYWLLEDPSLQEKFPEHVAGKSKLEWLNQAAAEKSTLRDRLFAPVNPIVKEFLQAVVYGDQAKAEAILTSHSGMAEELLTTQLKVTDYSGRKIKGTALQLALGAEDVKTQENEECMVEMLMKHLRKLPNGEAMIKEQINDQFPEGWEKKEEARAKRDLEELNKVLGAIAVSANDEACEESLQQFRNYLEQQTKQTIKTGKHFNSQLYEEAWKKYDEKFDEFDGYNSRKNNAVWCKVIGYIQRFFPACYAQAHHTGLGSMMDYHKPLKRAFTFENYDTGRKFNLFPLDGSPDSRLGIHFAVYSLFDARGAGAWGGRAGRAVGPVFQSLCRAKTTNLGILYAGDVHTAHRNA